jgi:hypothetical protein
MAREETQRTTRTTRVTLAINVSIRGQNAAGSPFNETCQTLTVNANGCLLEMATPVAKEQPLVLKNVRTTAEIPCTVVSLGNNANGKTQVALRFEQPSPRFWGLGFPPEDWDPADRKRPEPMKR